ncbi:hypothetical protein JTB14_029268 [Gonioctena quinquepunctata]|nr:hypothetical protein JTB14_029268 [Gonioctena quinquepunctata]
MTIITNEICGLLRRRYHYLENTVNATLSSLIITDFRNQVGETKRLYAFLYDIVEEFNTIFGMQFILMFINSFFDILNICNLVMINRIYVDVGCIARVTYSLMYLMCTLIMIMSCDMVENSAVKLLNTCNYLRATTGNNLESEELHHLSEFIEELSPKFTAAGFFRVNRKLIPAFLSSLTSYIIILIQFKMT